MRGEDAPGATLLRASGRLRRRRRSASTPTPSCTSSPTAIIGDNYPVPDRMLRHAEQVVHALPRAGDVRRPPAARALRPLRRRGRHGGHVLRLQAAWSMNRILQPRRHHRARHADLHAVPRDPAPRRLRLQAPSRSAQSRDGATAATPGSTPTSELDKLEDPADQGLLPGQPEQPGVVRHRAASASKHRRAGADEAAGPHPPHRRRLRHLRARLPLAGRRAAAQHHPRLLVLEALRLHRLAPRRGRAPRGQRHRRR